MKKSSYWKIMLIPSAYAIAVWVPLLVVLSFQIITVDVSIEAYAVYLYTVICFGFSAFINYRLSKSVIVNKITGSMRYKKIDRIFLLFFILIGGFGILKYVVDFSGYLDGDNF